MPLIVNSPRAGATERLVVLVEEVKSAIGPCLLVNTPRELADAVAGIADGREELQVA